MSDDPPNGFPKGPAAGITDPLRVLIVDDSEEDAFLIARELERIGRPLDWRRVDTEPALRRELGAQTWHVITCDWRMPHLSPERALAAIGELAPAVPAIIVSGQVGEEYAVGAMRAGARDFVSKHDLTRLQPAVERELREAEERRAHLRIETAYRALVDHSLQGLAVVQHEGFVFANRRIYEITGYSEREFLSLSTEQRRAVVHPDDRDRVVQQARQLAARGGASAQPIEIRIVRKDGAERWVQLDLVATSLDGETALQINCIDVTERKRIETRLLESEELHRLVLTNMSDTVLVTDGRGAFRYVCPNVGVIFGYSDAEVMAMTSVHHLLEECPPIDQLLALRSELANAEWQALDKNGHPRTVLVNVKPVSILGGRLLFSCRDVTKRDGIDPPPVQPRI